MLLVISYDDGNAMLQSKLGSSANVTIYDAGTSCPSNIYCSDAIPCTNENEYCNTPKKGVRGIGCFPCPEDPLDCYFENNKEGKAKTWLYVRHSVLRVLIWTIMQNLW